MPSLKSHFNAITGTGDPQVQLLQKEKMKLSIPYRAVPLLLVVNTFRPRQTWNSDSHTGEDLPLVTDSGGASGLDKVTNAAK